MFFPDFRISMGISSYKFDSIVITARMEKSIYPIVLKFMNKYFSQIKEGADITLGHFQAGQSLLSAKSY